jgi:hypothetical protein
MGGTVIIGIGKSGEPMSDLVNGVYWDSFGDLLDLALSDYQDILAMIKCEPGKYLKFYSLAELDRLQFNIAIKQLRSFIKGIESPTEWETKAIKVWIDVCEPLVINDTRYENNSENLFCG